MNAAQVSSEIEQAFIDYTVALVLCLLVGLAFRKGRNGGYIRYFIAVSAVCTLLNKLVYSLFGLQGAGFIPYIAELLVANLVYDEKQKEKENEMEKEAEQLRSIESSVHAPSDETRVVRFCRFCGAPLVEGSIFCARCGNKL